MYTPSVLEKDKTDTNSVVHPTIRLVPLSAHPLCNRRLPKGQCSLIPASQKMRSDDLKRATRSGRIEFQRHAEKSQMDEMHRPHDFSRHLATPFSVRTKPRRYEATESPVPFAIPA